MPYVGYTDVSNQSNTTDGFSADVNAVNVLGGSVGAEVGATGVVDLYGATPFTTSYIADETAPGLVLQEDSSKIILESS